MIKFHPFVTHRHVDVALVTFSNSCSHSGASQSDRIPPKGTHTGAMDSIFKNNIKRIKHVHTGRVASSAVLVDSKH